MVQIRVEDAAWRNEVQRRTVLLAEKRRCVRLESSWIRGGGREPGDKEGRRSPSIFPTLLETAETLTDDRSEKKGKKGPSEERETYISASREMLFAGKNVH